MLGVWGLGYGAVYGSRFRASDFGISGLGFSVWGFRVSALRFSISAWGGWGSWLVGLRFEDLGRRGCDESGLGFRV